MKKRRLKVLFSRKVFCWILTWWILLRLDLVDEEGEERETRQASYIRVLYAVDKGLRG